MAEVKITNKCKKQHKHNKQPIITIIIVRESHLGLMGATGVILLVVLGQELRWGHLLSSEAVSVPSDERTNNYFAREDVWPARRRLRWSQCLARGGTCAGSVRDMETISHAGTPHASPNTPLDTPFRRPASYADLGWGYAMIDAPWLQGWNQMPRDNTESNCKFAELNSKCI